MEIPVHNTVLSLFHTYITMGEKRVGVSSIVADKHFDEKERE